MNRISHTLAILLAIALLVGIPPAVGATYQLGSTFGHLRFTITKWGVFQEEGIFRDVSGTLDFDPKKPESARVDVVVKSASIDTNNSTRDRVLRSDDFFDAEKFPTLEFHSTRVSPRGEDRFDVTGALTVHGTTKTVIVSARLLGIGRQPNVGELAGFETDFTIDRTEFGVVGSRWSGGQLLLSKNVQISVRLGGIRRE